MAGGEIIQGLDLRDVLDLIDRKNSKFQAIALQEIEEVLDKNSIEFKSVRKIILDNQNEYTRSIIRAIFGDDFEYISKNPHGKTR